jgi:hypothetical protein
LAIEKVVVNMWSTVVPELSVAAIAPRDDALCSELLADLLPIASTCGVSRAFTTFAGSHAHTVALFTIALGGDGGPFSLKRGEAP